MSSMASIWLLLMVTANTFINIIGTIYHFFVGNKLKDKNE